jgi:DNA modification methylase
MPTARILVGDVRTRLADIPDNSIQACITSPPYWGLRDYGTATWEGGDPNCDHQPPDEAPNSHKMTSGQKTSHAGRFAGPKCYKCGARRIDSQIGLEQTPDEYVAQMVEVFREVRRVLRDDGVLWLNLGDSYAMSSMRGENSSFTSTTVVQTAAINGAVKLGKRSIPAGLKQKDLVGIPWRVAFALQADGWWLRQDIIWHKPNPMPESVTDRCTKAHEYLFMLTKSAKYYFDNQAIQEDAKTPPGATWAERKAAGATAGNVIVGDAKRNGTQRVVHGKGVTSNLTRQDGKRNRRSVWTIPTKPFRGAHFAVMPEALVEPCILASSRQDDTILDPFTGSGTVAVVSLRYDRNYIGTELNPDYVDIARQRITDDNPMFNELTIE